MHFVGGGHRCFGHLVLMYFVWFVVAGPDRPVPEKPKPRAAQGDYTEWEAGPSKAGATAASAAHAKNNLYDRLHSAVAERG
jgi:syntaxin-binding protein 5